MSKFAEIAKKWYEAGKWTKENLKDLVRAGRITEAEYEEIVGEPYAD